jgi:hypothetical protein
MCVALLALFIACGGTAIAAGVMITSGNQIRNGIITGSKIARSTIKGANIAPGTIGGALIGAGAIGTKEISKDAVAALQSAGTTAYEYVRKSGPDNQPANSSMRVITAANVPAGVYAVFAKTVLTDLNPPANLLTPGTTSDGHCSLAAGGDIDTGDVELAGSFGSGPGDVNTQITVTFAGPGTISVDCNAQSMWRASDSTIIAIRLGNGTRMDVPG